MTDQLEQELRDVLAGRAGDVGHPSFGGDAMVTRGRAARRRRQGMAAAGTAAAVVAALVVGGALLRPTHEALPPAERKPAPVDTKPAPVVETPFGLEVVVGDEIMAPDGKRTRISLPKGHQIDRVSRVPGGWVIADAPGGGVQALWFQPVKGQARPLSMNYNGSYAIAADGKRIAFADGPDLDVTLRELPSGKELKRTKFETALGPVVEAIIGDRVVIQGVQGSDGARGVGIWDVSTGALTRHSDQELGVTGLSTDGSTALSRLHGVESDQCAVFGSLDDLKPDGGHRFCGDSGVLLEGNISPDGHHLVGFDSLSAERPTLMFADVKKTRARKSLVGHPVGVPKQGIDAQPLLWENDNWLIVRTGNTAAHTDMHKLLRCPVNGDPCVQVPLPVKAFDVILLVQRHGV